ncbi:MAG: S8 family serine peptidase [Candidatus Cryptobacteroides sp.]
MGNKRFFLICSLTALLAGACQSDKMEVQTPQTQESLLDESAIAGMMRVKLPDAVALSLIEVADADGVVPLDKIPSLNGAFEGMNITQMKTTFHIGGQHRNLQIESGLHKWFDVSYDSEITLTKATDELVKSDEIEVVSRIYRPTVMSVQMNDPRYSEQWHYYNTGQNGFTKGIDIKLQQAWDTYGVYGRKEVVVAVIDSGVDYTHPDLNMWVNTGEVPNNGIDDDGNGYIDDVYGYNFVQGTDGTIHIQDHGTHVAGTIAAVNNNGMGVCGIAGGDGSKDSGVRVMTLQILDDRYPNAATSFTKAIQYACENGAVIAQNSWGYMDVNGNPINDPNAFKADQDAIIYFNKNAGQFAGSPMSGGISIFASGNSNADIGYPAAFEEAVAVAAVGPTGDAAPYTNYGDWIDVCAPGGDTKGYGTLGGVLSTTPNSTFGYMQGTSMACPHVSGLAALMVSGYGGNGYTSEKLRKDLIASCDESIYETVSQSRQGLLGKGLIDAVKALSSLNTEAPQPIKTLRTSVKSNFLTVEADVPTDDGGTTQAYYFHIYYSVSPFDASSLASVSKATYEISKLESVSGGLKTFVLGSLDFNTKYYFAVTAGDFAGNESAPTEIASFTTGSNSAPVLTPDFQLPVTVRASEKKELIFTVYDPDGHDVIVTVSDRSGKITVVQEGTSARIIIDGTQMTAGNYSLAVTAEDIFGGTSDSYMFDYEVLPNSAPVLVKPIESFAVNGNGSRSVLDATEYFTDPDGESFDNSLTLIFSDFDSKIISVTQEGPRITFTGKNSGYTAITLKVADARGASVSTTFNVIVRNKDVEMDVYPNPTADYLHLRTGSKVSGTVEIFTSAGHKVYSAEHTIDLNAPLKLDVKSFAAGSYTVVVAGSIKAQFVKL